MHTARLVVRIADSIIKSDEVDYLTDTITCDQRKYLGTQVTLSSVTIPVLSIGYSTVMTEDTQTVLDAAIAVLQELADEYAANTVEPIRANREYKVSVE